MSNGTGDMFDEARRRQRSADIVGAVAAVTPRRTLSEAVALRTAELLAPREVLGPDVWPTDPPAVSEHAPMLAPVGGADDGAPEPAYTRFTQHELDVLYAAFEKVTRKRWADAVRDAAADWKWSVQTNTRAARNLILWEPVVDECRAHGLEIDTGRCSGRLSTEMKWAAYGRGATRDDVARIKRGWMAESTATTATAADGPVVARVSMDADVDPVDVAAAMLRAAFDDAVKNVDAIRKSLDVADLRRARIADAIQALGAK